VTSWLGTGKPLNFFFSVPQLFNDGPICSSPWLFLVEFSKYCVTDPSGFMAKDLFLSSFMNL
jgi:hypothetical protein